MSANTNRIAKNTLLLYVRMIIVMLVSLYTSRLVLQALGVDDFGLFGVVGGVVGLLTFFNRTMEKSTQRFLNISMVEGKESLGSIFASSITVHLLMVGVFFALSESIGLWFLNTKVNIPEGRELAANMVYQTTVLTLCTSFMTLPYSAAVIAFERMSFFAIISIVDAFLKLCIAWFLLANSCDRLILYGFLILAMTLLNFAMYFFYCRFKYSVLKFRLSLDINNFKRIFSFVGWTLVGQSAIVGCNQGNVVLVNMFHSVVANAAMTVGNQVNHAILGLTTNFQTAFNPQITKSYAAKDFTYLKSLVYTTSKFSYCILLVVALPIAFNIDTVLNLWLKEVPLMSNEFAVLFLVNGMLNALSSPFNFTVLSSENIKNFQIITAILYLLDIPITFLIFSMGFPPTAVLWVKIGVMIAIVFVRIRFASSVVPNISLISYIHEILLPLSFTSFISISLAFGLNSRIDVFYERLMYTILIEAICILLIWFICFKANERTTILKMIKSKTKKYVTKK